MKSSQHSTSVEEALSAHSGVAALAHTPCMHWLFLPEALSKAMFCYKYLVTLVLGGQQLFALEEEFTFHGAGLGWRVQT